MLLFDEKVNLKATAQKVDDFFTSDYGRLKRMASITTIKATSFGEKVSSGKREELADKYNKAVWARNVLEAVEDSIMACDEKSKLILELKYKKHYRIWQIYQRLGYSESGYNKLRVIACNQFADAFEALAEPLLEEKSDLHVYEK
ncbi:ArpU family phage packaging/lysis transcriptional regulator [Ligilactobacillus equi]|uniref:Phage transcriptional regulator, ArpU family n=1 Tax=Ligilactobacillus equi DSM 15833 = JCM 10991 TaxID=1423740 RepID=A0A0R1TK99_9LACO|nr:ArpU family phage packaging/lysis transcriptional regulator [Ligilactobacillus equi]KRL81793.1 hypothetical protein FC36_GL001387 [Ligilactobacillus equi DSM 15833 = JCM 10991]